MENINYSDLCRDLLATKIEFPALNCAILPRKRCIILLDQGLEKQITLITAPTGYGKTTLLAEWLKSHSNRAHLLVWIALDTHDNSPLQFWSYVIAGFQNKYSKFRFNNQQFIKSGFDSNNLTNLNHLINAIAAIPSAVHLVLDDYQEISNETIHAEVNYLITHLPNNLHVTFSSRTSLPFSISRLRAQEQLIEITSKDLAFTLEETKTFLTDTRGLDIPYDQILQLFKATEGWIAGITLAAHTAQNLSDMQITNGGIAENNPQILEYMTEEVINKQGSPVRDFLLKTSILSEFCAPLCDSILGRTDSQEIIQEIERLNLFIQPLDQNHYWYRYQSLFAENLTTLLKRSQPEIVLELHMKACDWLQKHGYPDKAVSHAIAIDDFDNAAKMLDDWSMQAIKKLDLTNLVYWISYFPEGLFNRYPNLGINYALANQLLFHQELVEPTLRTIENALKNGQNDPDHCLWKISIIRTMYTSSSEDNEPTITQLLCLLKDTPENDTFFFGLINFNLAIAYESKGDYPSAIDAYERGIEFAIKSHVHYGFVHSLSALARIQKIRGNLAKSKLLFSRARDYAAEHNLDISARALALSGLLDIDIDRNDIEQQKRIVQEITNQYEMIESGTLSAYNFSLLTYHLIRYFLQIQDFNQAGYYYRYILKHDSKLQYDLAFPEELNVQIDFELSSRKSRGMPIEHNAIIRNLKEEKSPTMAQKIALARMYLSQHNPQDAITLLQKARIEIEEKGLDDLFIQTQILLAVAYKASGDIPLALESLKLAIQSGEKEGYITLFLNQFDQIQDLLMDFRSNPDEHHLATSYLDYLIEVGRHLHPDQNPMLPEEEYQLSSLTNSLSDREKQVLKLLAAGRTTKEVASNLMISKDTTKSHIKHIYKKLGLHSRSAIMQKALVFHLSPNSDKNTLY
jgi:LuxR family transcriptional regulator, maltose regulon positive regulatory protein